MDIMGGLSQAWSSIATFVPKLALFLVILLVGWFIAKMLAKFAEMGLRKVGFDRAVDKSGIGRMLERSNYDAIKLVAKLLYYFVLLIVLQASFAVFGTNPISDALNSIVSWLPKAAVAIIIVVIAGAIANAVKDLLTSALSSVSYGRMLANIAAVFIVGLGIVAALNQIGVAGFVTSSVLTAVLATIAGVLIIGIGGGLVRPMQDRWGRWLNRIEEDSSNVKAPSASADGGPTVPQPTQPPNGGGMGAGAGTGAQPPPREAWRK
jgi:hypothetical protein